MNSRSIGKLTSVSQRGIIAEIYSGLGNYISTNDGVRFVGEVGSYVSIYDVNRTIIGEITGVEEKPQFKNAELNNTLIHFHSPTTNGTLGCNTYIHPIMVI